LKFLFKAFNNEDKYKALVAGIRPCYTTGAESVRAYYNSQLVVSQLNGVYELKDNTKVAYVRRVWVATVY